MKKIFIFLILAVSMASCYEDYIFDNKYDAVYFPYQYDVRTFVVGEGMKIEVGAALAGVRANNRDRTVNFKLENTLLTPELLTKMKIAPQAYIKTAVANTSTLAPMPSNYYTLSNSSVMVIKSGQHGGTVVVKADSAAFLADAANLSVAYAIPFYISSADADSVLEPKRYVVIGLKYENMLFGNYWHSGATVVNRPGKTDTTYTYRLNVQDPENKIWKLTTVAPNELTVNGYGPQTTTKAEMKLTLNGGNITVSPMAGSTYAISPEGNSAFNQAKLLQDRKIFLKYTYSDGTNTYHSTDTLTFRNRVRDGVNEWQDENASHYSK